MLMDNITINHYKRLIASHITAGSRQDQQEKPGPITRSAKGSAKKRGSYYITLYGNGQKQNFIEKNGWIMDINGLMVGCSKNSDYSPYIITDIITGLAIGEAKTLARVPAAVLPLMDKINIAHSNKTTKKLMQAIEKAYSAQTALQAI